MAAWTRGRYLGSVCVHILLTIRRILLAVDDPGLFPLEAARSLSLGQVLIDTGRNVVEDPVGETKVEDDGEAHTLPRPSSQRRFAPCADQHQGRQNGRGHFCLTLPFLFICGRHFTNVGTCKGQ